MISIVVIASGNGSNMENIAIKLHDKTLTTALRENGLSLTKSSKKPNANSYQAQQQKISADMVMDNMKSKDKTLQIVGVISNKKDAYVIARAKKLNIPTFIIESNGKTREDFENLLYYKLCEIKANNGLKYVLLAGFMRILSPSFFTRKLDFKILNIHPSFLPLHKGTNAIEKSFVDSNDFGGVTVHFVSEEVDSGNIILQEKIPKIPNESLESFATRIHELEHKLYPQALLMTISQNIDLIRM
ncbi:phosphoribosylglycinamide formyltransferase [Helicobacter muridarum]|uniref:Phosphoribosylglycinamide formyltransferase n=1 Tax=Helicobacter muridarum TaxID=216 RepID=A0A099TYZ8_9HELI|nr:phosphoribosylglycinamide formyltransferase [Helicobacter muridarum]TLE01138.1 phosphoribosylglycinamide formyltransferase [Helicobacter muridarum]STQ86007.1 phosphoribosylglycinamide formyltransferase [Helicobacter muridarum]